MKTLAQSLPTSAFQSLSWREDTNETFSGRFAAVRVRHVGGNLGRARLWPHPHTKIRNYLPGITV